jgi:hypothetical protein
VAVTHWVSAGSGRAILQTASVRDGHREMIVAAGAIHVGGCLTAFVVGVILKQAGLSNQCPAGRERMFVCGCHAEWWALIMRAIK